MQRNILSSTGPWGRRKKNKYPRAEGHFQLLLKHHQRWICLGQKTMSIQKCYSGAQSNVKIAMSNSSIHKLYVFVFVHLDLNVSSFFFWCILHR